jgi:hypothetical protein
MEELIEKNKTAIIALIVRERKKHLLYLLTRRNSSYQEAVIILLVPVLWLMAKLGAMKSLSNNSVGEMCSVG